MEFARLKPDKPAALGLDVDVVLASPVICEEVLSAHEIVVEEQDAGVVSWAQIDTVLGTTVSTCHSLIDHHSPRDTGPRSAHSRRCGFRGLKGSAFSGAAGLPRVCASQDGRGESRHWEAGTSPAHRRAHAWRRQPAAAHHRR